MAINVMLYRHPNPEGSPKDWACPITVADTVLTVFYGRTGSVLRQADTPAHQCEQGSPSREAARRVREKVAKGYVRLGAFCLGNNRRDLTPVAASISPAATVSSAPESPCLYWRRRSISGRAADPARVDTVCQDAIETLVRVGWIGPGGPTAPTVARLWSSAAQSDPVGHGVAPLEITQRAQIAFWLLLAQQGIVELADEAGRLVTRWPPQLPLAAETLEALGLQPKDVRQLLAAGSDGEDWFFG